MIVVDTSALIAILDKESDAALYAEAIADADPPLISAATLLEVNIEREKGDILLFSPFARCNSGRHTVMTDLWVPFPATDQWKARESLRWASPDGPPPPQHPASAKH